MASGATTVGTGATVTFAGFTAQLTSISIDGPTCGTVPVPHLALARYTAIPHLPQELIEPGTVTVEGYFKASEDIDEVVGTNGSLSILMGHGAADTWAWTDAIMTSFSATIPLDDVETCSATWQLNSDLTVTAEV